MIENVCIFQVSKMLEYSVNQKGALRKILETKLWLT